MRCHGSVTKKLPRRCCPFAAPAAIFAGVQPSRLILRVFPAVRGRCPRLLIVQPSRLRSSLRLFLSLTFSLLVSSSLLPLSPVQQKCLSLEGYTVSNPGQRPGIARGKERLAWRAIRPRRWRREPQREGALCVDEDGLKDHTSLLQADSSLLPATKKIQQF